MWTARWSAAPAWTRWNSPGSCGIANRRSAAPDRLTDGLVRRARARIPRTLRPVRRCGCGTTAYDHVGLAPIRNRRGGAWRMVTAFQILLVLTSVLIILLVLLHKGKGGGLSDLFGGGVSSSLGGSSIAERNLDRITYIVMIVWTASCISLALLLKH